MDIWKHGKYVDTWSIVHLFSGFLLSGVFFKLGFGFWQAFCMSFVILLAWEGVEWLTKIIEPSVNVVMDMIIGTFGFLIGGYLYYMIGVPFEISFYSLLGCTTALALWGFLDFKKRGYR